MQRKGNLIVLLIVVTLSTLNAQQVLLTSGGKATASTGSATYSVGQIAYKSFTNTTGSITQGILQPTMVVTALDDLLYKEISCKAFPNPTTSTINLKIENRTLENVSIQLYDLSGKMLYNQKINQTETSISTESLNPSTYLLRIRDGNQEIKTFKIIKY
jgi:Secretion system C-terminal sorting domain